MNLSTITDVTELKAMLSDQRDIADQAAMNIQVIRQRIAQIEEDSNVQTPKTDKPSK